MSSSMVYSKDSSDNRPQTAFKNNIRNQNNSSTQLPQMQDKRAQSAGYQPMAFQKKQIKPIYQELGFIAPQSAKSAGQLQKQQQQQQQQQQNEGVLQQQQQRDYKRIIPKVFSQDQEKLYEELLKTKTYANQLQVENYKLKTKVSSQEGEIHKHNQLQGKDASDNILSSSISYSNTGFQKSGSSMVLKQSYLSNNPNGSVQQQQQGDGQVELSLIPTLKKQVKDLTQELKERDKEMSELKRNVKLTKLSELEVELKSYADETIRLRHLLQQSLQVQGQQDSQDYNNNMEERYVQQVNQNNSLKNEMQLVQQHIEYLEEQIKQLEQGKKEIERVNYRLTKEKTGLKKQLYQKEKDLDRYRAQDPHKSGGHNKRGHNNLLGTSEGQLKAELEKKILEINNANIELTVLQRGYDDLKQTTEMKNYEYEEQIKTLNDLISERDQQLERKEKQLAEAIERCNRYKNNQMGDTSNRNNRRQKDSLQQRSSYLQSNSQGEGKSNLFEVQNQIGYELKYRLMIKKKDPLTFDKLLFSTEALSVGMISYKELSKKLQSEPFLVMNGDKLANLLRYLMGDDEDEGHHNQKKTNDDNLEQTNSTKLNTQVDQDALQSVDLVLKNFHDVVMNFKKLKREDEKSLIKSMNGTVLNNWDKFRLEINKIQIQKYGQPDGQECTRAVLIQGLKQCSVEDNMVDYIMCKLYEETRNIDNINLSQMHQVFQSGDNNMSPLASDRNLNVNSSVNNGNRSNTAKGTHTPSHYRFSTKDDITNPSFGKYADMRNKESSINNNHSPEKKTQFSPQQQGQMKQQIERQKEQQEQQEQKKKQQQMQQQQQEQQKQRQQEEEQQRKQQQQQQLQKQKQQEEEERRRQQQQQQQKEKEEEERKRKEENERAFQEALKLRDKQKREEQESMEFEKSNKLTSNNNLQQQQDDDNDNNNDQQFSSTVRDQLTSQSGQKQTNGSGESKGKNQNSSSNNDALETLGMDQVQSIDVRKENLEKERQQQQSQQQQQQQVDNYDDEFEEELVESDKSSKQSQQQQNQQDINEDIKSQPEEVEF